MRGVAFALIKEWKFAERTGMEKGEETLLAGRKADAEAQK